MSYPHYYIEIDKNVYKISINVLAQLKAYRELMNSNVYATRIDALSKQQALLDKIKQKKVVLTITDY